MFPDHLNPLSTYFLSKDQIDFISEFELEQNLKPEDLNLLFYNFANKILAHQNCPLNLLEDLKHSTDLFILEKIASNPATPLSILKEYLDNPDEDDYVLKIAASNPSIPVDLLINLSFSLNESIVAGVASNHSTPSFVLEKIAEHSSTVVLEELIFNPNSTAVVFDKLIELNNSYLNNLMLDANISDEIKKMVKMNNF